MHSTSKQCLAEKQTCRMPTGSPICCSMVSSPPASSRERRQQDLRDLTRLRVSLVQERARLESSIHKVLDAAGCQLSAVLSDIVGFSGKRILQALCEGESDPMRLAQPMHPGVKATKAQVVAASRGRHARTPSLSVARTP